MLKGPRGERRPADVIGAAAKVMRIAIGEEPDNRQDVFGQTLISQHATGKTVTPNSTIAFLGVRGQVFNVNPVQSATNFSDSTKSALFVRTAINSALKCPICRGLLDPSKSVSYDHKKLVSEGGTGDIENGQLVHPYCNSARESLAA